MTIPRLDILCRVVDNYGDAGVVLRLARALSGLDGAPSLRLIVDDLGAFASIAPGLDPALPLQTWNGWTVARWDDPGDRALSLFRAEPPLAVIESFASGRPDWYEAILFDGATPLPRHIVDLEYLSAENFAQDYHLLPSLTRSPLVRKALFMPGFTVGTGGLILDRAFLEARVAASDPSARPAFRAGVLAALFKALSPKGGAMDGSRKTAVVREQNCMSSEGLLPSERQALSPAQALPDDLASRFLVLAFTYERDFSSIVRDLAAFGLERPVAVFAAAGKSQGPFLAAWEAVGRPFPVVALPFLSQLDWDRLLLAMDFSIVRGEDSFSRAALSGRPFLWQAYPQEHRHHLVKVEAFLKVFRAAATSFPEGGSLGGLPANRFDCLEALFFALNDREADTPATTGTELLLPVLRSYDALVPAFASLSQSLLANGDLSEHLLSWLTTLE